MSRLANRNKTGRVIRALGRAGCRIHEGRNHTIAEREDGRFSTIPRHDTIKPHLLRAILRQLGISEDEFIRLY